MASGQMGALAILALRFTDTITLGGAIIAVLIGFAGLVTYGYGLRWKSNFELEKVRGDSLEEGRIAFKSRAERLGAEKDELQQELARCQALVEELGKRPELSDLMHVLQQVNILADERSTHAVAQVTDYMEKAEQRTIDAFAKHEQRAQERHEAEMGVMKELLKA